jgi:DNA-binding NarL/FixJ family response regulator
MLVYQLTDALRFTGQATPTGPEDRPSGMSGSLIRWEVDVLRLIAAGMTDRQIAITIPVS